jgi:hypothetical protein
MFMYDDSLVASGMATDVCRHYAVCFAATKRPIALPQNKWSEHYISTFKKREHRNACC